MWKTVLFDLDGTITDSGEGIMKSAQYALQKGFQIEVEDLNDLRFFVGPPLISSFMKFNLTEDEAKQAVNLYRERYNVKGVLENQIYENMAELIQALKKEGLRVALSSSKPTVYCRQILDSYQLTPYFDVIVGSELDGTRVDKAEVIEEVIRQLGPDTNREELVLVGDRSYDILGAKKAQIASVGVTFGYGNRAELEAVWPECIVDSVSELKNVLIGQYREGMKMQAEAEAQKRYEHDPQAVYKQMASARYAQEMTSHHQPLYPFDGSSFHRIMRIVWPMILGILINFGLSLVYGIIAFAVFGQDFTEELSLRDTMLLTGIMDVLIFIIMYKMYSKDEGLRYSFGARERLLGVHRFGVKEALLMLCAIETCSFFANLISSYLIPLSEVYESLMESMKAVPPVFSFILVVFFAPFAEELLFRGVIYRRARDYYNIYTAAIISGVLFGIFHLNLSQGIPALVIGFVFCLLYEHYGTLKANILCHIVINAFGSISILTENETVLSIIGVIMAVMALIGIGCLYYIFKKDERVNRI